MKNLITIGLPSKGRLKDKSVAFFDDRGLKVLPNKHSLFETVLVSSNDEFVELFLNNKIKFHQISKLLLKFIKLKEFNKFKKLSPKNVMDIMKLSKYVRLKITSMSV